MDEEAATTRVQFLQGLQQAFLSGRVEASIASAEMSHGNGLRAQLDVLDLWTNSGEPLGGWKVGMTSGPARDRMGVGFRPFGYILASRVMKSGTLLELDRIPGLEIEPELAFLIDKPLQGMVDRKDVMDAISQAAPAFELQQIRLEGGVSDGIVIADDLGNWGIVLGEPAVWAGSVSEISVTLERDGEIVASEGPGFGIDEPIDSILSLCHSLAGFGRGLDAGQWIITGAFARFPVSDAGVWRASFSGIGDVQVDFS